jgi:HSP20 family protein
MSIGDLIPWRNRSAAAQRPTPSTSQDPFLALHQQINRLFDDFTRGYDLPASGRSLGWPSVELKEDEKRYCVEAELPGMEEKDIEVLLTGDVLTIRGEKRIEKDDAKQQYSERYFGQFERHIPLDGEVEPDNIKAKFKNGVLKVEIPKSAKARERARRIPISH